MDDRAICLLWDKLCLDTPRQVSSLWRTAENLLKFTREYGDILVCQLPPGTDTEKSSMGVYALQMGQPIA